MSNDPFDISANAAVVKGRKIEIEPIIKTSSHQNTVDAEDVEPIDPSIEAISTTENTKIINGHEVRIRGQSPQQIAKGPTGLWTPNKFAESGQVRAGEVDDAHTEFLKGTTFVTEDDGNDDTERLRKRGIKI